MNNVAFAIPMNFVILAEYVRNVHQDSGARIATTVVVAMIFASVVCVVRNAPKSVKNVSSIAVIAL